MFYSITKSQPLKANGQWLMSKKTAKPCAVSLQLRNFVVGGAIGSVCMVPSDGRFERFLPDGTCTPLPVRHLCAVA